MEEPNDLNISELNALEISVEAIAWWERLSAFEKWYLVIKHNPEAEEFPIYMDIKDIHDSYIQILYNKEFKDEDLSKDETSGVIWWYNLTSKERHDIFIKYNPNIEYIPAEISEELLLTSYLNNLYKKEKSNTIQYEKYHRFNYEDPDLIKEEEEIEDEKISVDFAKTIFETFETFIKISFIMGAVILLESIIIAVLLCK